MIEIKNFSKNYPQVSVYEKFNLTVEEGKITCILGESGSGKTTLLNAIARLTDFEGDIPSLKCSYIFQEPRLVPNLTVTGNLKLVCKDENKILSMLQKVGLEEKAAAFPIQLSGGQAQRVSIARAFLSESEIILMDEPFSSLDLKLKSEIIKLFFEMHSEFRRTVIFVTHNVDEAVGISERIIVISGGRIIYDCVPETSVPRSVDQAPELRQKLISVLLSE